MAKRLVITEYDDESPVREVSVTYDLGDDPTLYSYLGAMFSFLTHIGFSYIGNLIATSEDGLKEWSADYSDLFDYADS
jgi:hypothetical protein